MGLAPPLYKKTPRGIVRFGACAIDHLDIIFPERRTRRSDGLV